MDFSNQVSLRICTRQYLNYFSNYYIFEVEVKALTPFQEYLCLVSTKGVSIVLRIQVKDRIKIQYQKQCSIITSSTGLFRISCSYIE